MVYIIETEKTLIEGINILLANFGSLSSLFIKANIKGELEIPFDFSRSQFNKLTELSIVNYTDIGELLVHIPFANLSTINLGGSIAEIGQVEYFSANLKACKNLQELNLSNNNINQEGGKLLANGLEGCRSLLQIDIGDNKIPSSELITILQSIKGCKLTVFSANHINRQKCPSKLSEQNLKKIMEEYDMLQSLQVLQVSLGRKDADLISSMREWRLLRELRICLLPAYDFDVTLAICNCLQHFKELEILELKLFITNVKGAKSLMTGLRNCCKLKIFNLSENNIHLHEMKVIAANLVKFASLKELYLNKNSLHDDGAKILSSCLQYLPSLQILDIGKNSIHHEGLRALAVSIQHCTHLRRIGYQNDGTYSDVSSFLTAYSEPKE